MSVYRTKFSAEKVYLSLEANGDTNKVHRDANAAKDLIDAMGIKFRDIPELRPTLYNRLLRRAGLRPRLPIVPGILEIFEARKFVRIEEEAMAVFPYMHARFNFPILVNSRATVDVEKNEAGYTAKVNVPYNSLEGKAALEASFEFNKQFHSEVNGDNLEMLLKGEDPRGKRVITTKEIKPGDKEMMRLCLNIEGKLPDIYDIALYYVPSFLISTLEDYKRKIGEEFSDNSLFLYNSQKVWLNNRPKVPFDEGLLFSAAIRKRDTKDGRVYTAEIGVFSGETPLLYGESSAFERAA